MSLGEESRRKFCDAIVLVIRDVDAIAGVGAVSHVVDHGQEATLEEVGPDVEQPPGYLMICGHSGGGLEWEGYGASWQSYVVSAARSVQHSLLEDDYYWGKPFPPCSAHPDHSLVPVVVDGKACWACPNGTVNPIEIGQLAKATRPQ